ncbi:CPS_collapsed_G0003310.mRNA.1.CDS.1 [Saccharomyces cerevisiae]|nr:CPS_collapsed_G0003310.mRNA.1.CDS.1 [Saccharomyces cerevisiae]
MSNLGMTLIASLSSRFCMANWAFHSRHTNIDGLLSEATINDDGDDGDDGNPAVAPSAAPLLPELD